MDLNFGVISNGTQCSIKTIRIPSWFFSTSQWSTSSSIKQHHSIFHFETVTNATTTSRYYQRLFCLMVTLPGEPGSSGPPQVTLHSVGWARGHLVPLKSSSIPWVEHGSSGPPQVILHSVVLLAKWMSFLMPNHQCQSTDRKTQQ